jgi:hypothetical protein
MTVPKTGFYSLPDTTGKGKRITDIYLCIEEEEGITGGEEEPGRYPF